MAVPTLDYSTSVCGWEDLREINLNNTLIAHEIQGCVVGCVTWYVTSYTKTAVLISLVIWTPVPTHIVILSEVISLACKGSFKVISFPGQLSMCLC